ncbi:Ninein, partial [Stegodyphus mimosarum]
MKINLADLTSVLEEVLINVLNKPLLQLAFLSFQNEMQFLRQTIDQMQKERSKLRVNVEEANTRAALLAQEVDDNHAKLENSLQKKLKMMEKKYQDQARELVEELQQERDAISSQSNKLKQQLQADIAAAREEESKLKSRLSLLEQENSRLEQELLEATEKCIEAEKLNEVLQKELSVIPDLKARLGELENNLSELQDRNTQMLLQELETCKKTNQSLQDKIDELTLEMESMHQNSNIDTSSNKGVSRTHSWLSDYKKASFVGYKRRGSGSSSDDNSEDESPSVEKIRKTYLLDSKTFIEPDFQNAQNGAKLNASLKGNQPSSVDILLKDMLSDQTHLMQKLQVSEEKRVKMERAYRHAERKIKILSHLLTMSTLSEGTAVS